MSQEHCRHHPAEPAVARCHKHGHGLCAACLDERPACFDPELYCKFRPQCVIAFQEKEARREARRQGESP